MTVDGDGCTMRGGWWGDGEWGHEGLMKHERERESGGIIQGPHLVAQP